MAIQSASFSTPAKRQFVLVASLMAVSLAASGLSSQVAHAQQVPYEEQSFSQRFKTDYYRNKAWPLPFRAYDIRAVSSFFDAQRNNGWQLHNTLGSVMFTAKSGELTDPGIAHVRWIVTSAPRDRRVVFIKQADTPHETAARVESTQLAISRLVPVGPLPQIYLTDKEAPGSSGVYQTSVLRAMTTSVPSPRLPAASGGGSSTP